MQDVVGGRGRQERGRKGYKTREEVVEMITEYQELRCWTWAPGTNAERRGLPSR